MKIQNISPNQALWEKGDFTKISVSMIESGEHIVSGIGIEEGMAVLDLGCGDGTTAVPAAKRGANVLGVDISRNLVEAGNRRAQREGLSNLKIEHGNACALVNQKDNSFDRVVSVFGAMFAPDPFAVLLPEWRNQAQPSLWETDS
ncbi:MAG: class I SAM-dependent methyltransferase [Bdellovibrionales bacterium]